MSNEQNKKEQVVAIIQTPSFVDGHGTSAEVAPKAVTSMDTSQVGEVATKAADVAIANNAEVKIGETPHASERFANISMSPLTIIETGEVIAPGASYYCEAGRVPASAQAYVIAGVFTNEKLAGPVTKEQPKAIIASVGSPGDQIPTDAHIAAGIVARPPGSTQQVSPKKTAIYIDTQASTPDQMINKYAVGGDGTFKPAKAVIDAARNTEIKLLPGDLQPPSEDLPPDVGDAATIIRGSSKTGGWAREASISDVITDGAAKATAAINKLPKPVAKPQPVSETAPETIKAWLGMPVIKKKMDVIKCKDARFLNTVAEYENDRNVIMFIGERITELEDSSVKEA